MYLSRLCSRLTKSVSQSSSLPGESIALRDPSELAAEPCLPKVATWKHAPTKLLSSSLRYVAEVGLPSNVFNHYIDNLMYKLVYF